MAHKEISVLEVSKAVAYYRTSSAANVGPDKDSERRQREAIRSYAQQAGVEIVAEYYDAAVSGADPIDERPGFAEALKQIDGTGVRTIIVETASRFARDLMVQEAGYARLQAHGINLVAADSPSSFRDDTPTARFVRQVLGAAAELDKSLTIAKLRGARDRKRAAGIKVEGQKSLAEREGGPALVAEAKRLHRKSPKTRERLSLREIAIELQHLGYESKTGRPLAPSVVQRLIKNNSAGNVARAATDAGQAAGV